MNALEGLLSRPRSVLTIMIALVFAGIVAYITVPKEANPDIDVPIFYISVTQQGISPEDSDRLLVRPLETKLRGLDGLKEITSIASEGHAGIILEFDISFDKDEALIDVRDKVDQARAKLPSEADEPEIFETNFSLVPTIVVALSGQVPERTLYRHARQLKDQIEAIPTVLEANLAGHREELLEVIIDTLKLESYNISQDELISAVTRNNQLVPAGALDRGQGRFNIKVPGLFEDARDVFSLPVRVNDDGVVTLSDVATINRTFKDPTSYTRFNGHPAIAVEVVKRIGTNIIENNAEVRRVVGEFSSDWPDTINVDFTLDQSKHIFEVIGSLQSAILTAIALVMVIVIAALGMRSALLVGLAIPASFMIGFLIVGLLGMTVNIMVMFGLVLTVGMLVDGAIVIVEYADRKMVEGLHRRDAYTLAAKRMFWPIFSSTATTLAAFLPMLFWPGVSGEFMSFLPLMVIIVLTASLITAMIFLPVTGGLVGKTTATAKDVKVAEKLSSTSVIDYNEIHGFTGVYVRGLKVLLKRPITVFLCSLAIMGAVFYSFTQFNNGVEFFVEEEPDNAVVLISGRGNLSVEETRDLVVEVEQQVLSIPGIKAIFTTSGSSGNRPKIGGGEDKPADQIGQLTLELEDYSERRKAAEIFEEIRTRTASLAGIRVEVRKIEGGPPTGKDIRLQIAGPNFETVRAVTGQVTNFLETGMQGVRDVEDTRPLPGIEWELQVDREEAGRFGTDIVSVGAMVQLVTNGVLIGTYRPDNAEDEIDIRVRFPEAERSINRLDEIRIRSAQGWIPIGNLTTRTAHPLVSSIMRKDGKIAMLVKANTLEGILADEKVAELNSWLKAQSWPDGMTFRFRGADEEQKEAGAFLGKAMAASLFLMFIILVTQFNSFYQTILTLSTVIMSIVGVLIGMLVTGQTFSIIMTGTGVVALAGIVVNNAIVLIDTYNRMRELGLHPVDAVLRACVQRLRPVLLTTFTTILGLVPMALQITVNFFEPSVLVGGITAIWWVQLSTAVIFGLGFATLLTLILIPTLLSAPMVTKENLVRLGHNIQHRRGKDIVPEPAAALASETPETGTVEPARAAPKPRKRRKTPPGRSTVPEAAE
ncbi:MAG: efflux RND transporter permease subunit [Fimbriimonadaceae bacterium]|nr:efflux RND transporter permease subunit [Alphaproteobacteria bacterium]